MGHTAKQSGGAAAKLALAGILGIACWTHASAADRTGPSVYLEAGQTLEDGRDTTTSTIGLRMPMQRTFWDGRVTGNWDLYLSEWRTRGLAGQRRHYSQVGLVPMFRYRFDAGQSPWFVEGGIGLSYMNEPYQTESKRFSTQWNFSDHLGLGRNFGSARQHELGLYVKHVSNAGLRRPNPGETFVQLRYGYNF